MKPEDVPIAMGHITEGELIHKAREHRDRFFDCYRSHDSTREPEIS